MSKSPRRPGRSSREPSNSETAGRVLEQFTRYRFLTARQMVALGVTDESSARWALRAWCDAGVLGRRENRLVPGSGRLSNEHWLTGKGASLLADNLGVQVVPPRPLRLGNKGYAKHRIMLTDVLIAADKWAAATGQVVEQARTYLRGDTPLDLAGQKVLPDAILAVRSAAGERRVYVVEASRSDYSGGHHKHPVDQLAAYAVGAGDEFDNQLGIAPDEEPARVLVACDTAALLDRLVRTVPARSGVPPENPVWGRFRFKVAERLGDFGSFAGVWCSIDGSMAPLPA